MSSAPESGAVLSRTFGLRIGLWYAALFVAGSTTIVLLTYVLTAVSLEQRDQQVLNAKLGEYAAAYYRGGAGALAEIVRVEQQTSPERLFVRVATRGSETVLVSQPDGWNADVVESASMRLADGTVVQVAKSAELRRELLGRFRAALGVVTLTVVLVALVGGLLVTRSAVQPIMRLTHAVQGVIRTGRTDARVPVSGTGDALDELTALYNAMLDRIERLVQAMRGSLDNVSHDLRTPLTHLRGSAETALAGPPDLDRYRDALADCVEETDRVLVMLTTLMDISEAESGAMRLQREPIVLGSVVERALGLYHDVAEAKGVVLTAGSIAEVMVSADRTRLEQVAANLIDNAVKYTPAGGAVEVRVARDGDVAVLAVRDTGPGIPPDELPRIWDRLFRGDASRTARGLGLGLSLVKAVVEAHGGTVDAASADGRGSVFSVRLPLAS